VNIITILFFAVLIICLADVLAVNQYLKSKNLTGVQGFVSSSLF